LSLSSYTGAKSLAEVDLETLTIHSPGLLNTTKAMRTEWLDLLTWLIMRCKKSPKQEALLRTIPRAGRQNRDFFAYSEVQSAIITLVGVGQALKVRSPFIQGAFLTANV